MNIIDGLPTLSHGAHPKGSGRACVMQYVSVLAGEEWTDAPRCTLPALGSVAIHVNDALSDEDRHLLVPYIARLINTNGVPAEVTLAIHEADNAYIATASVPCDCMEGSHQVLPPSALGDPKYQIGRLDNALAAYDRATARPQPEPLSDKALRELAEAVAA